LSEEQLRLLDRFAVHLLEWNRKINLISRRDEQNFWTRHVLHCLSLVFKVEIPLGVKILDLGTGGGLPGVVLKIVRPDLLFTLLDSTKKKINVVKDLLDSLGLGGIDAVWGRAEDLGKQREYAGRYDIVVARAVAPLKDLVHWSYPFLRKSTAGVEIRGGSEPEPTPTRKRLNTPALVAFKGGDLDNEIGQLRNQPNVDLISTIELTLKGSTQIDGGDKKIVVVEYGRSDREKAG
jgi:16S rRNA (guanine527-N7)-methyltransferase